MITPVRISTLLLIATMSTPISAGTQLIDVTAEVFAKMQAIAVQARAKHPTSPSDAATYFTYTFNGEFGDVLPTAESTLVQTSALSVILTTPINLECMRFIRALGALDPLPAAAAPIPAIGIAVTPKQMDAPNVTKIALFRGDTPVSPISDSLQPQEFVNRMGAKVQIASGVVLYPVTAFASGDTMKVVLITDRGPIERSLDHAALARLK